MDTFSLRILKLSLLLVGSGISEKYHFGCVYVTDSERCPDPNYIQVYLFTKNNAGGQIVTFGENSDDLMKSSFNPKNPNKILIHGFNSSMNHPNLQDIKEGLDPAGPGFITAEKNNRLDPSDARFVDVIHTNGAVQGYFQTCGDVDFYVNGGVSQPGCFGKDKGTMMSMNCNHRRALIYFAESINSNVGFLAWKCKTHLQATLNQCQNHKDGRILMGEHCPKGSRGVYYVATARQKPFALVN